MTQSAFLHASTGISSVAAGKFIQARRKKTGITQTRMAEQLGVYRSYYSHLENGRYDIRSNPERLAKLVTLLKITEQELLENLGVSPVHYTETPTSRHLGKLSELKTSKLPQGIPVQIPSWILGNRPPESCFLLELANGSTAILEHDSRGRGAGLERTPNGWQLSPKAQKPIARVIGMYIPS